MNPKTKITLILTGLCVYLLFPVDLIPDVIPFFGEVDDMGVVLWGVKHVVELARCEERTIIGRIAA